MAVTARKTVEKALAPKNRPQSPSRPGLTALQAIRDAYRSIFAYDDDDLACVDFLVSSVVSSRLSAAAEPAWGILVGPPGSSKTESMRPIEQLHYAMVLDEVGSKALNSGFVGEEVSLLPQLNGKVIVWPELTTLITQDPQEAAAVMGSLRRAFDGEGFTRATGVGLKSLKGQFGFIACCTGAIDRFLVTHTTLGDRFLKCRLMRNPLTIAARRRRSDHVREAARTKAAWRKALAETVGVYLNTFVDKESGRTQPDCPEDLWQRFQTAMMLIADCRTLPHYRTEPSLEDPESEARLQQQIANLVWARSVLDARTVWNADDLRFALRVAVDTLSPEALVVIAGLAARQTPVSTTDFARTTGLPGNRLSSILRQYGHAGLAEVNTKSQWRLSPVALDLWRESTLNDVVPRRLRGAPDAPDSTRPS